MAKILVADDETDLEILIRQKFRKQIREQQYEFVFAINGREALEKLEQQSDIDIVLSDINMPEMDGLTLLSRLNEVNPILKAVIVSAYGDMDNIRIAMNRGAFDFICKPVNFDDLETTMKKTLKHVDQLRDTLRAIHENNILKMYVDENVLSFMNRKAFEHALTTNETIEATVAFIDICGFTAITENEKPDTVVNLLNKYFDVMVKHIIAQNGHIDKFIGDAILAVFPGQYHLDRAIEASLAIRAEIEKMPHEDLNISFLPKITAGLHSGEMVRGNIGSSSLRRFDYTVIGDVVNTAQRLQGIGKAGQIIITESSYEQVKNSFTCEKIGEVQLKHKSQPYIIYNVVN